MNAPPQQPRSASDPMQASAADFEETPERKIARLQRTLAAERRFAVRASRQLHRAIVADLRAAERRAEKLEAQRDAARERVRELEAELEEVHGSTRMRVGRAVVAVPVAVRRRVRELRQR